MQNYRITFYGDTKDTELAEKLCSLCSDDIELSSDALVTVDSASMDIKERYSCAVAELGTESNIGFADRVVTYSVGQSNADICALNFQTRDKSKSLELLSGSFMGRVNIPISSEYTELSVLLCAAGLYAAGVPMAQVLKVINGKIS